VCIHGYSDSGVSCILVHTHVPDHTRGFFLLSGHRVGSSRGRGRILRSGQDGLTNFTPPARQRTRSAHSLGDPYYITADGPSHVRPLEWPVSTKRTRSHSPMAYVQATTGAAPMIVYGVPIEDPTVAEQVKRVMNVAAICFAMGLMGQLGGAVNGTGQLFGIFAVSLVPACGYYGAKGKNRGLLGCFWCCNGCTFFFGIVMVGFGVWFVTSNAFLFSIMGDLTHCCGELDDKSAWTQTAPVACKGDDIHFDKGDIPDEPDLEGDVKFEMHPSTSPKCTGVADEGQAIGAPADTYAPCYSPAGCQTIDATFRPIIGDGGGFYYVILFVTAIQSALGARPPTAAPPAPPRTCLFRPTSPHRYHRSSRGLRLGLQPVE
jgi:hypothetical protein